MQVQESIIIVVYLVLMIIMGLYFARRAQSSEDDYWSAGRRINSFVGGVALFAAIASASSLMGAVGGGVELGLPFFMTYAFAATAILPFTVFLISGQIRRAGVRTMPEYFKVRYGRSVAGVAALIVVVAMTFYMVPQLTASGLIGQYVLGIDYGLAVLLFGAGFTLYAALGGMWAITYTDLIQGIIMLGGLAIVATAIWVHHAGPANLLSDALAVDPELGSVTQHWMTYFGIFLAFLWFGVISPSAVMRNFAAKSAKVARRSAFIASIFYAAIFTCGFFMVLAGAGLGIAGELDNTDMIFLQVLEFYLPPIVAGILMAALISAIMSSADAMLLAISAGVSQDLFKGFIRPQAREKTVVRLGIVVMFIAAGVGMWIAWDPPGLIAIMVGWVGGALLSTFGFPVVLGIWWKRANAPGALAGMLGGGIAFIVLVSGDFFALVAEPIIAAPISLVLTVVVSLLTSPPTAETRAMVDLWHSEERDAESV
ncbi:sodium:solute symporter family protein [Nesterenkonia natronophila]|uniref:Na+:solute symporter n=1 Tax=Nesterenkonia natronophila TaxID=2174932 RepID=A0A3A4FDV5_9MICC|nr:sodium/solute symporter [Nesterenkonia natronophila]RJN32984.1 Na+:solute symporter [Nesterenkonia natronophila]